MISVFASQEARNKALRYAGVIMLVLPFGAALYGTYVVFHKYRLFSEPERKNISNCSKI